MKISEEYVKAVKETLARSRPVEGWKVGGRVCRGVRVVTFCEVG